METLSIETLMESLSIETIMESLSIETIIESSVWHNFSHTKVVQRNT